MLYYEDHQFAVTKTLGTPDSNIEIKTVSATDAWSIHITDVVVSMGSNAGSFTLQDEDDNVLLGPLQLGVDTSYALSLNTPIKLPQGKNLEYDKEAASDEGSVFVAGYLGKDV